MLLLASPLPAQDSNDGLGPPTGTPVNAQNTNNPSSPPNLFTIPAQNCTVADTGASVTLKESDGTQGRVVDGQGVKITATADQIRIEILNDGDVFDDVAQFSGSDRAFDTGNDITFVSSAGITCAGGGTGQNQSTPERSTPSNVIKRTVPKKPLPPTGGLPVYVMVTGSIVAGTSLLGMGIRRRPRG